MGKIDNSIIQQQFTNVVENMLEDLYHNLANKDESTDAEKFIDNAVKTVCDIVMKAATNLPTKRYNKKLKPYWNKNLTTLTKEKKKIWHVWVEAGRPRGENEIFRNYKEAKKAFRNAQIEAIREY